MKIVKKFNSLANKILEERYLTEIAKAMTRFIVKKTMEVGSSKLAESLAQKKDDKIILYQGNWK